MSGDRVGGVAYPELHAQMSGTGLGTNLGVPDDGRVMYRFHIDGPKMKCGNTLIGRRAPLHATALGQAILAGNPPEDLRASLAQGPSRRSPDAIRLDVDAGRSAGLLLDAGERGSGRLGYRATLAQARSAAAP